MNGKLNETENILFFLFWGVEISSRTEYLSWEFFSHFPWKISLNCDERMKRDENSMENLLFAENINNSFTEMHWDGFPQTHYNYAAKMKF